MKTYKKLNEAKRNKIPTEPSGDFRDYMLSRNYQPSTIEGVVSYAKHFLKWVEVESLKTEEVTYNDLLSLVKQYREQKLSRHTINCHLLGIQHYYEWLIAKGELIHNPAVNLRVKGVVEKLPSELLSKKQLENIYENYKAETPVQKRNKIIISFLIYQGVVREELQRIEPKEINLQKGTIRIRKTVRLQERILKLSASQILPLQEYIKEVRPKLLQLKKKQTKNYQSDKLLITIGHSHHLHDATRLIMEDLRKEYPYFKSFIQVRNSVINGWIKERNIREVQYMAGHNSIISTQRLCKSES
jgi:integrase/recombinase XerD